MTLACAVAPGGIGINVYETSNASMNDLRSPAAAERSRTSSASFAGWKFGCRGSTAPPFSGPLFSGPMFCGPPLTGLALTGPLLTGLALTGSLLTGLAGTGGAEDCDSAGATGGAVGSGWAGWLEMAAVSTARANCSG